jgi:hypothetical protein
LEVQTKNTVRYDWYNPKGNIDNSGGQEFTSKRTHHKTWAFAKLDGKYNRPPGQWTVKVFFNNHYIFSKKFVILENSAQ